jgi:hypothetical protein
MAATNAKALQTVPAIIEVAAYPAAGITNLLANNSNAQAVITDIETKILSWSRLASVTDLAITRNVAEGMVEAETDDNATVFRGARPSVTVSGNWFEEGNLDSLQVLLGEAYTAVAASPVAVTNEAKGTGWTQGTPIRLNNKNGANTIVSSIVIKENAVTLALNTDYRTYVGNGSNGDLGFTYIVPVSARTLAITADYSYTPTATRYTGLDTTFREMPRLVSRITTLADSDGKIDVHYVVDAGSTGDVVKNLVDSVRAGEVKSTPFEITVNKGGFLVSKVERF